MRYSKWATDVSAYTFDDMKVAKDIYKDMCTDFNPRTITVQIRRTLKCGQEKARVLMCAAKFHHDMTNKGLA